MNERPHVEQLGTDSAQENADLFPDLSGIAGNDAASSARRPRARKASPAAHVSPFGGVPVGATMWALQRVAISGAWEAVSHPDGTGARRHEWPLADLSIETVKTRHGVGTYRVQWFKPNETGNGGRKYMACSPPVTLEAPPVVEAPPAVVSPGGPQLQEFVSFMNLVDGKTNEKIEGMAALARTIVGNGQGQLTGRDLLDALRDERASAAKSTEAAILAAVAPLQAKIDALTASQGAAGGGLVEGAAQAAASAFGKGTLGSVMNFAASQPELAQTIVEKGAPVVQAAIVSLLGLFSQAKNAAPVQQQPQQRPRATLPVQQQQPAAQQEAAPSPPVDASSGSISGWETRPSPVANGAGGASGPVQRVIVVEAEAGPA